MNDPILTPYCDFHEDWALVAAGNMDDHNAMTVSWGGIGCLWNKPVATVYIRPNRHTYGYFEKNEYFTVSFYPGEYKKALGYLGTKSGRDEDKIAAAARWIKDRSVLIYVKPLNDFLDDALRSIKGTFFETLVFVRQILIAITNQIMLFPNFIWDGYLQIAF